MLTANNGIIKQSLEAKTQTDVAGEKEAIAIAYNGAMIESKGQSVTAEELNSQFGKNGTNATATAIENEDLIKIDFSESGRSYIVDAYGIVEKFDDIANYLKVGDYVNYLDKNGNKILCKVLYNNENYGVQIVALNPVDTVTLGYDDLNIPTSMASKSNFEKAKYSYNNAVKTLNDKAEEYRNSKYTIEGKARCIGSLPDDPYNTILETNNSSNYSNEDWDQLNEIDARRITDTSKSSYYWLCSGKGAITSGGGNLTIRNASSDGNLGQNNLCQAGTNVQTGYSYSNGFRPVFRLKSNVKIDNSNGKDGTTEDKAYDLQ